jgi:molybdopterin-guanine dinucleotide biosynthesis protein A
MDNMVGIVLAGGRSTRFGTDKARVVVGAETVVERLLRLLAEMGCERAVVGGEQPLPPEVPRVADLEPGGGPLQALAAAGAAWPGAHLLVLACDLPLLDAALLAWLSRPLPAGIEARVPRLGGFAQPLAALYAPAAMAAFVRAHAAGERVVLGVLAGLAVEWADEAVLASAGLDARRFSDFDTRQQLRALGGGKPFPP